MSWKAVSGDSGQPDPHVHSTGQTATLEEVSAQLSDARTTGCVFPADKFGKPSFKRDRATGQLLYKDSELAEHPHHPSLGDWCPVCSGQFPRGMKPAEVEELPPDPNPSRDVW